MAKITPASKSSLALLDAWFSLSSRGRVYCYYWRYICYKVFDPLRELVVRTDFYECYLDSLTVSFGDAICFWRFRYLFSGGLQNRLVSIKVARQMGLWVAFSGLKLDCMGCGFK